MCSVLGGKVVSLEKRKISLVRRNHLHEDGFIRTTQPHGAFARFMEGLARGYDFLFIGRQRNPARAEGLEKFGEGAGMSGAVRFSFLGNCLHVNLYSLPSR